MITISHNKHKSEVVALLEENWGGRVIVRNLEKLDASKLPFITATNTKGRVIAFLTYHIDSSRLEIVSFNSFQSGCGTMLLNAVKEVALDKQCKEIRLTTTNDNSKAVGFYLRRGFNVIEIRKDIVKKNRRIKNSIPMLGSNKVPIEDEIEFSLLIK